MELKEAFQKAIIRVKQDAELVGAESPCFRFESWPTSIGKKIKHNALIEFSGIIFKSQSDTEDEAIFNLLCMVIQTDFLNFEKNPETHS